MSDSEETSVGFALKEIAPDRAGWRLPAGWEVLLAFVLELGAAILNDKLCLVVTGGLTCWLIIRHQDSPADVVGLVFATACVSPLLRRVNDLLHGYHPGSMILIAPYLPYPVLGIRMMKSIRALRGLQFLPALLFIAGVLWAFAFGSLAWGIVPASVQLLQYMSGPIVFWYLLRNQSRFDLGRLRTWFVVLGGIEAAYGLYQWSTFPAWDKFWYDSAGLTTGGTPLPFMFRTFGTLNSVAHFAYFNFFLIVVTVGAPGYFVSAPLMVAGLATTQGRSTWGATAVGLVLAILLAPARDKFRLVGSILVTLGLVVALALPFSEKLEGMAHRVMTVKNLKGDGSFNDRNQLLQAAISGGAFEDPVGVGLGGVGAAARSSGKGMGGIDNGFLQTVYQFGWIGSTFLFSAILLGFGRGLVGPRTMVQALFLAAGMAMFSANIFSSSLEDVAGVMMWIGLAVVSMKIAPAQDAAPSG